MVELHDQIEALRAVLGHVRAAGRSVGFVPTMGYLHEGHLSLMRRAVEECDVTVASIYVNPLQFGVGEDLDSYPRDLDSDLEACKSVGVDHVFAPTTEEMYPEPVITTVAVPDLSATMEGASRPTHFAGVTTVVTKLFNIVGPCRAYFGEKDYQQLAIVTRMAADLSMPVTVVGCPIVREPDGLAMSSRNVYLSPEERAAAPVLRRALGDAADAVASGITDGAQLRALIEGVVASEPTGQLDYAAVVDPRSLQPLESVTDEARLLVAVRFGRTRLLDNLGVRVPTDA